MTTTTTTTTIRAPKETADELVAAAQLFACTTAELVHAAWQAYRVSPEFAKQFSDAQAAFAAGDLDSIAERLNESRRARAEAKVLRVRGLRSSD